LQRIICCVEWRGGNSDLNTLGIDMNTFQLEGSWNVIRGKLKRQYAGLTDEDLRYAGGKEEELIRRIQQRTGRAKEEIEEVLDNECCYCGN